MKYCSLRSQTSWHRHTIPSFSLEQYFMVALAGIEPAFAPSAFANLTLVLLAGVEPAFIP